MTSPAPTQTFEIPEYVLDDLCSRFVINIPEEERVDLVRVFFQIELAHWFYLDFYCEEIEQLKPCGIKDFSSQLFRHCPFLSHHAGHVDKILEDWKLYKMSVPTYGAIMLDPTLSYVLLVQGFRTKSSWGFPKGKVNENEPPTACAIREVYEETGYQLYDHNIHEDDYLEAHRNQLTRLYVITNVPMEARFQPQSRNEIKCLQWFPVDQLPCHSKDQTCKTHLNISPNNFFMVIPFIKQLRKWIEANRENHFVATKLTKNEKKTDRPKGVDSAEKGDKPVTETKAKTKNKKKKIPDSDARTADKMRQKFAQANRNELLILYGTKSADVERATLPGDYPWPLQNTGALSEKSGAAPDTLNVTQSIQNVQPDVGGAFAEREYPISAQLRDIVDGGKQHSVRRSLNTELDNGPSAIRLEDSSKAQFHSDVWLNFKFDISAIMACIP